MRILFWLVLTALPVFSEGTVPLITSGSQPKLFTEITFAKGESTIDVFGRQALDQVVREASQRGRIDEVQVISWGDVEYPTDNDPVPVAEVDLARNRGRAVEEYLNRGRNLSVRTYNMAQTPDGHGPKKISRSLVLVVLSGN